MSSSGLVALWSSVRAFQVTGRLENAPLPVLVIVPEPSVRLPFQVALAVLVY